CAATRSIPGRRTAATRHLRRRALHDGADDFFGPSSDDPVTLDTSPGAPLPRFTRSAPFEPPDLRSPIPSLLRRPARARLLRGGSHATGERKGPTGRRRDRSPTPRDLSQRPPDGRDRRGPRRPTLRGGERRHGVRPSPELARRRNRRGARDVETRHGRPQSPGEPVQEAHRSASGARWLTQIERADRRLLPAESLARAGRPGHRCPGKALPVADAGGPRDEGAGARRVRFPRPPGARGAATLAPRPAATRRTPARLREHA